jgi:hypothetical protein
MGEFAERRAVPTATLLLAARVATASIQKGRISVHGGRADFHTFCPYIFVIISLIFVGYHPELG